MNPEAMAAVVGGGVLLELSLGDTAPNFNLEKAVCSHGLFMMAPNHWDSSSKTLRRPLRLNFNGDETSLMVYISHSDQALHLRVFGMDVLSPQQQQSLLIQVKRMFRLSERENKTVMEFHEVHEEAKERGFGRVFRSPTLFEDMIKCILLCNCQWSRTLSMAQALCELQYELQHPKSSASNATTKETNENNHFVPKTPAGKETKRRSKGHKRSIKFRNICSKISAVEETETKSQTAEISDCSQDTGNLIRTTSTDGIPPSNKANATLVPDLNWTEVNGGTIIGNFPSPKELACLDEKFLAKRCNLGYRAGRVINLARGVIEGTIQLEELEYTYDTLTLSHYSKLVEKLRVIDGFGPFTCANVLMCIGFYHVIPTDSETIRHLIQVHGKNSTIRTIEGDLKDLYGKYAPFQFLAYWFEVWHFYEERFGNLSEMPHSSYKLITAANMKPKKRKLSPSEA